jgi:hypothetical protein
MSMECFDVNTGPAFARPARVLYSYEESGELHEGSITAAKVWIDGGWVHVFDSEEDDPGPDQSFPAHAILAVEWR